MADKDTVDLRKIDFPELEQYTQARVTELEKWQLVGKILEGARRAMEGHEALKAELEPLKIQVAEAKTQLEGLNKQIVDQRAASVVEETRLRVDLEAKRAKIAAEVEEKIAKLNTEAEKHTTRIEQQVAMRGAVLRGLNEQIEEAQRLHDTLKQAAAEYRKALSTLPVEA